MTSPPPVSLWLLFDRRDYVRVHLSLRNDFNVLNATQDYGPVPTYNLESKSQFCPEAVWHSTMKNGPCSKSWHSHGNL